MDTLQTRELTNWKVTLGHPAQIFGPRTVFVAASDLDGACLIARAAFKDYAIERIEKIGEVFVAEPSVSF